MADVVRVDGPRISFKCPGCKSKHTILTHYDRGSGPTWTWNGSKDKPTFSPSVLVTAVDPEDGDKYVCHSFVNGGEIRFLNDCTHELAGKTVNLGAFR